MSDIAVIGGGISGLSVAYFLSKMGFRPTVLEREESVGGLGGWHDINRLSIDSTYHIIFKNDAHIISLLKELGMADDLIWNTLRFRLDTPDGSLVFSPLEMLHGSLISKADRIRLAGLYLRLNLVRDWRSLDGVSAREWVVKNGGIELYKRVFEPIIESKWGADMDETSAAWLFGRIKPRAESRGLFGGSEKAGYLTGSFQRMFSALDREITRSGGEVIKNADVRRISFSSRKASVRFGTREIPADAVISTLPLPELVRIARLPGDFESALRRVRYKALICTVFGLSKALTNSYRTVFSGHGLPFGGVVELTNLVSPRNFNNQHILYVFHFLDESEAMFSKIDEEILKIHVSCLERLFPDFSRLVLWSRLYRNRYAEPFYQKNYLDIMPGTRTPLSRLFITGMVQSYPVSDFNSIIALSRMTARLMEGNS